MNKQHIVSSNVRIYRKKLGITQQQLADLCGFKVSYVSRVEREAQNITMDSLDSLAKGLGVTPEDLVKPSAVTTSSEAGDTVGVTIGRFFDCVMQSSGRSAQTLHQIKVGMLYLIEDISKGESIDLEDVKNTALVESLGVEILGARQFTKELLEDVCGVENVFTSRKTELDQISNNLTSILQQLPPK